MPCWQCRMPRLQKTCSHRKNIILSPHLSKANGSLGVAMLAWQEIRQPAGPKRIPMKCLVECLVQTRGAAGCGWVGLGCSNVAGFVYVTSVDMTRCDYTPICHVDSNTSLISSHLKIWIIV